MQCCFTNHFTKLVLFLEYLNLKCYSLDSNRNQCHFLNSPHDGTTPDGLQGIQGASSWPHLPWCLLNGLSCAWRPHTPLQPSWRLTHRLECLWPNRTEWQQEQWMGSYHLLVLSPTATHSVSGGSDNSILRRAPLTRKPLLPSEFCAKLAKNKNALSFWIFTKLMWDQLYLYHCNHEKEFNHWVRFWKH